MGDARADVKNNGHQDQHRLAVQELFQQGGGHSPSGIFVTPGEDPLALLMRTEFKDERQLKLAILLYSKFHKLKFQRGVDDLRAYLAALCSLQGKSRLLALFVEAGILAPGMWPNIKEDKKRKIGGGKLRRQEQVEEDDNR